MAVSIKSMNSAVTVTQTAFLTATKPTVITGGLVSNTGTGEAAISVLHKKSAGSTAHVVKSASIPQGSALTFAGGDIPKLNLEVGDQILANFATAATGDIIISYLET